MINYITLPFAKNVSFLEMMYQPCRVDVGPNENSILDVSKKRVEISIRQHDGTNQQDAKDKTKDSKRQHRCILCSCTFINHIAMVRHMHRKHAGLFILCKHNYKCNQIFRTEAEKSEHILGLKNKNLKKCDFCNLWYQKTESENHFKRHHKNDNFIRCSYYKCSTRLRSEVEKQNHEALVHATTKMIKCIFCNLFFSEINMLRHFQTRHKSLLPSAFKCNVKCRKYFLTELELNEHKAIVHSKYFERRTFKCIYCNKIYLKTPLLRRHINLMHAEVKICCNYRFCFQYFHTQAQGDSHFEQKHQKIEEKKKFRCLKCNYRSSDKAACDRHMSQIHGDKSLPCLKCPKQFGSSAALKIHLRFAHKPLEVCPHCNKSYSRMEMHLKQEKCKKCQKVLLCVYSAKLHKMACKLQTDPGFA
jgi:hypothetical protein